MCPCKSQQGLHSRAAAVTGGWMTRVVLRGAHLQGYSCRNVLASFVHLHFGSCPALAAQLVERCAAVDVAAVGAASAAAAEAAAPALPQQQGHHARGGVASFGDALRATRGGFASASVSPESHAAASFGGHMPRPIFPVRCPYVKPPWTCSLATPLACIQRLIPTAFCTQSPCRRVKQMAFCNNSDA